MTACVILRHTKRRTPFLLPGKGKHHLQLPIHTAKMHSVGPTMMISSSDGGRFLNDSISTTHLCFSSLLINIYFKIENIFHLSVLIVCFIYFKLNIFLCIISLPIKMMLIDFVRDVNNPLICLLVFFNRKK